MRRDTPNQASELRAESPHGLLRGSLPAPSERYPLPQNYPFPQNSVMSAAKFPAVLSVCVLITGPPPPGNATTGPRAGRHGGVSLPFRKSALRSRPGCGGPSQKGRLHRA